MRKHALSNNGDKMNPNSESGILLRKPDRLLERSAGYHQARAGQHAFLVSANDCFIHFLGHAKVVRVDDQPKLLLRASRWGHVIVLCFRQKRASAASTLCKGSARLLTRRSTVATHRLAWACTNSLRLARSWRNSFASLYSRLRSCPLKAARRTILKMILGRK